MVLFSEPPPEEPDDDAFEDIINELSSVQKALKPLKAVKPKAAKDKPLAA